MHYLLRVAVEVVVIFDRLSTHVAHFGTARAGHHVTALRLVETFVTFVARTNHRLRHAILDERAHVGFPLFFHLITSQRNVAGLPTRPG